LQFYWKSSLTSTLSKNFGVELFLLLLSVQVVNVLFEGGTVANLTMTAFTKQVHFISTKIKTYSCIKNLSLNAYNTALMMEGYFKKL